MIFKYLKPSCERAFLSRFETHMLGNLLKTKRPQVTAVNVATYVASLKRRENARERKVRERIVSRKFPSKGFLINNKEFYPLTSLPLSQIPGFIDSKKIANLHLFDGKKNECGF